MAAGRYRTTDGREVSVVAARRLTGPVAVLNFAAARNPGGGHLNGAQADEPYVAGFLTAAAPKAGVVLRNTPERAAELTHALAVRAERVLETAAAHGDRRLVLGAWGCGVFRNDPAQVANAFGILDRTPGGTVRELFARTFA